MGACAVFPDSERVVTVSSDKHGMIWCTASNDKNFGKQLARLSGHNEKIIACAVFPSGDRVMTVSADEDGIIWSNTGRRIATLRGHADCLTACSIFFSGERVVTVSRDRAANVWSKDGAHLAELNAHTAAITSCAIFPASDHSERVVTASEDNTAIIWPMALFISQETHSEEQTDELLSEHTTRVRAVCVDSLAARSLRQMVKASEETGGWGPKVRSAQLPDVDGSSDGIGARAAKQTAQNRPVCVDSLAVVRPLPQCKVQVDQFQSHWFSCLLRTNVSGGDMQGQVNRNR